MAQLKHWTFPTAYLTPDDPKSGFWKDLVQLGPLSFLCEVFVNIPPQRPSYAPNFLLPRESE